jgi:tetratricopeptide (TPR) repeat protein
MDAARMLDHDLDQQTANFIAEAQGLPESARESFIGQYQLRKTIDVRIGVFLRKLSAVHASRILVSTRLYPADLQTVTGDELPRCKAYFLRGLTNDDALNMWRSFGVTGSRDVLFPLFGTFDNHPLLIQVLAGVVARDRSKPGDFDHWRMNHPDFDPFQLPLVQSQSHILSFALRGLGKTAQDVLFTIAAFRMPVSYDTLVALFVGEGNPFSREDGLVSILVDLEDRGLLGWDRRANRYDLHPIVRGVTWSRIGGQTKHTIYETLNGYFSSLPEVDDHEVQCIDDLATVIELYNTLIGLERFDEAWELLNDRFDIEITMRLGVEIQASEMLRALFLQGIDQISRISDLEEQLGVYALVALCSVYHTVEAARWYQRSLELVPESEEDFASIVHSLLVEQLCLCGSLYEAEVEALSALLITRRGNKEENEPVPLGFLGLVLAVRGKQNDSELAFERIIRLEASAGTPSGWFGYLNYAMSCLWSVQFARANTFAQKARAITGDEGKNERWERLRLRSIWIQCMAALELGKSQEVEEDLLEALRNARELSQIGEEIPIRIGLAELRRRQGNLKVARELLDEVWEPAERGSFRLYHADAYNVLAQIERDAGRDEEAFQAATNAYRLSWCDGPPYAYHYGLQKAKAHLLALHRPEPILPPFDPAGREPLPEVEIDPPEVETLMFCRETIRLSRPKSVTNQGTPAAGTHSVSETSRS